MEGISRNRRGLYFGRLNDTKHAHADTLLIINSFALTVVSLLHTANSISSWYHGVRVESGDRRQKLRLILVLGKKTRSFLHKRLT